METEVEVKRKGQNSNNLNHMKRGLYRPNDLPLQLAQYSTVRDIDEDRLTFSSVFPFSSALDPDLRGFYLRGAYSTSTLRRLHSTGQRFLDSFASWIPFILYASTCYRNQASPREIFRKIPNRAFLWITHFLFQDPSRLVRTRRQRQISLITCSLGPIPSPKVRDGSGTDTF
jgi:hypothetical protein